MRFQYRFFEFFDGILRSRARLRIQTDWAGDLSLRRLQARVCELLARKYGIARIMIGLSEPEWISGRVGTAEISGLTGSYDVIFALRR